MERKINTGVIYPKTKKNDRYPDYEGQINVEGKDYELSIWNAISKKGNNYLSVVVRPARNMERTEAPKEEKPFVDDPVPF